MCEQFQVKEMTLPFLDAKIERTLIHLNGRLDKCAYALLRPNFFSMAIGRYTKLLRKRLSLNHFLNV